jgi:hypothetical protein
VSQAGVGGMAVHTKLEGAESWNASKPNLVTMKQSQARTCQAVMQGLQRRKCRADRGNSLRNGDRLH